MTQPEEAADDVNLHRPKNGLLSRVAKLAKITRFHLAMWIYPEAHVELERLREKDKELNRRNDQLDLEARTDHLTGLFNERELTRAIARLEGSGQMDTTWWAAFDINNLKAVNDTLGHGEGDKVLKDFARVLLSEAGKSDTCISSRSIFRAGGRADEFIVFGPRTAVELLVERVSRTFQDRKYGSLTKVVVTGVVGVTAATMREADLLVNELKDPMRRARHLRQFSQRDEQSAEGG